MQAKIKPMKAIQLNTLYVCILLIFAYTSIQAQNTNSFMVVQLKGNILDCPHFGQKLSNEAAQKFNIKLVEKDDKNAKLIFQLTNAIQTDSLKNYYMSYLRELQFPMNYFKEIYFTDNLEKSNKN